MRECAHGEGCPKHPAQCLPVRSLHVIDVKAYNSAPTNLCTILVQMIVGALRSMPSFAMPDLCSFLRVTHLPVTSLHRFKHNPSSNGHLCSVCVTIAACVS